MKKRNLLMFLCLMLSCNFASINEQKTTTYAAETFTAMQTNATIGNADGIKDEAYNHATPISITHKKYPRTNPSPATAKMYLLWDETYLYVFAEVADSKHYNYQEGTWLEHRDAFEMYVDTYHNISNYTGNYGSNYRGTKQCEGLFKIAAGVGVATTGKSVQGTHWLWDDSSKREDGSYASVLTETGYNVEYKINLGSSSKEHMVAGRKIGVGVKLYDRYQDSGDVSITMIEDKNNNQHKGPQYLSSIKLVTPASSISTYMDLAYKYTTTIEEEVTTYNDVEFRLKTGYDASIVTKAEKYDATEYGVEVSTTDKVEKFAYTLETKLDEEANINYVVIGLGDIINNIDRATTVFTVKAYMVVNGMTYYSEVVKSYSVADMIAEYYAQEKPVTGVYNIFAEKGLYND